MVISEVSEKYGISPDTLRYYERMGLIPPINRNKSGLREYTEEDCKWVQFIICMRNAGMSIELLHEYVEMARQGDETWHTRKELLVKQRNHLVARIDELQKTLEILNGKIESYENHSVIQSIENLNKIGI